MTDKKKAKRTSRRFLWVANAPTHAAAVFKFAVFASIWSSGVSFTISALIMRLGGNLDADGVALAIISVVLCWMAVFTAIFGAMTIVYQNLILSQVQENPPTPPPPETIKEVFYLEGNRATQVHKSGGGGRNGR